MFRRVSSAAIQGITVEIVSVEVDVGDGLPAFDMVGLLSSEVRESKERVRTAIKNSGMLLKPRRVTIHLAPAGMRKEGGWFDLPIAVGILLAAGYINSVFNMEETLIVGELSLDGKVNAVRGVLAIVTEARKKGFTRFIVPKENAMEGALNAEVMGVETLDEVCKVLMGAMPFVAEQVDIQALYEREIPSNEHDFCWIQGQENARFAAKIAAAGRHNLLLMGPPGAGKSMIATALPSILPKPDLDECLEITKIQSIAGKLKGQVLITARPFGAPHHTITAKALVGGGNSVVPGEITIAHRGVLFLDELAEFRTDTLDALRQPLEDRKIRITRIHGTYEFPADFMLVAASNPCKCGYYPDRSRCRCSEQDVRRYLGRLSGPLLDRIDLCVGMENVKIEDLQSIKKAESSAQIRKQVEVALHMQKERYAHTNIHFNSELGVEEVKKYCYIREREKQILKLAFEQFKMSARGYYRTIKVARTIADLEKSSYIKEEHICQALGYRMIQEVREEESDGK